jgi:LAS superfamily LD-carboxypeptidase LdcB
MCPLLFTTAHRLRADAAFAFNAMAHEYAGAFSTPLCVTDSYRSYDAQVRVAAEKPDLAADPGHSNHGWGLATDLCGGIESFDTPTHQWMVDNAPRYGWFHPAWAEIDGSMPEPWHWEFAG